ncbi:MAG TPA: aspartate aminotransferase family protein, partial [Syntrophus sp. (in: bacteria)]|nr:aspartate aminotransferase family protein [Syntrophus sp. (in: bacteria)]
ERAFARGLIVYPGGGGADGIRGDHILIAPPFVITKRQIDALVRLLDEAVADIARETG